MRHDIQSDGLSEVACQVLEEMFFVLAEPIAGEPLSTDAIVEAEISFSGPVKGSVTLTATPPFCSLLTASLLGMEPDDATGDSSSDAFAGELLNVMIGMFAERWFGKDGCDFGLPAVRRVGPDEHKKRAREATVAVSLSAEDEDEQIDIAVFVEPSDGM